MDLLSRQLRPLERRQSMKWETVLTALVSGTIPAIIGYFVTKTKTKAEMDSLIATQQHEIDKLVTNHQLLEERSKSEMTSNMTSSFINGDMDFSKIAENLIGLEKMMEFADKYKSK